MNQTLLEPNRLPTCTPPPGSSHTTLLIKKKKKKNGAGLEGFSQALQSCHLPAGLWQEEIPTVLPKQLSRETQFTIKATCWLFACHLACMIPGRHWSHDQWILQMAKCGVNYVSGLKLSENYTKIVTSRKHNGRFCDQTLLELDKLI